MPENTKEEFQLPKIFSVSNIKRGVLIFTTISILTFIGIFLYTNTGKTLDTWSQIDGRYFLVGLVFVYFDLLIGGLRNHIFIRVFVPGISHLVSVKANLANIFMGAVTPSQSGGGPAQWYIFYRHGVPLSDVIGTSFYNWISTIVFFPISGAVALYILKSKIPEGFVLYLTQFGFSVFTTLLIVTFLGLFAPKLFEYIIMGLVRIVGLIRGSWAAKVEKLGLSGIEKLNEYRIKYLGLIKQKPHLMVYSFLLTILLYFNKYLLAYVIVLAFGLDVDFWTVIAIQAVVYLLLYFAPSPGGSGIAEISISALMASVIANDYLASFTLLYRSFLVFIPALIGAYVILRQLSKE